MLEASQIRVEITRSVWTLNSWNAQGLPNGHEKLGKGPRPTKTGIKGVEDTRSRCAT